MNDDFKAKGYHSKSEMRRMEHMKPREWWLDEDLENTVEGELYFGDALTRHPGQGPLAWQAGLIHVIEKSAYDELKAVLESIAEGAGYAKGEEPYEVTMARHALKRHVGGSFQKEEK